MSDMQQVSVAYRADPPGHPHPRSHPKYLLTNFHTPVPDPSLYCSCSITSSSIRPIALILTSSKGIGRTRSSRNKSCSVSRLRNSRSNYSSSSAAPGSSETNQPIVGCSQEDITGYKTKEEEEEQEEEEEKEEEPIIGCSQEGEEDITFFKAEVEEDSLENDNIDDDLDTLDDGQVESD